MENGSGNRGAVDELSALADELLSQAAEIRRQWAELGETLGLEPPEPSPVPERRSAESDVADPVRLVALDMVLSGRSREEVRDYLRATFGDGDREAVLDEVFDQFGG
jgi:hypothetical protein